MTYPNHELKKWTRKFIQNLIKDPVIQKTKGLKKDLVKITQKAYFTTFIEDYDFDSEGIGLSRLRVYNLETVNKCLDYFTSNKYSNSFIRVYVEDFKKEIN
ncbi:MAG: hypothetical protein ACOCUU_03715 [Nanoarchaeota archaeon]